MRSNLDGLTLNQKRYGAGFREVPTRRAVLNLGHCAAEPCRDPVYAEVEAWVDDAPPPIDWYTQVLNKLAKVGLEQVWVRVPFCRGHTEEFLARSLDVLDDADSWAPGRENPFVFPHPPKLVE